jgi:hypothetical protein
MAKLKTLWENPDPRNFTRIVELNSDNDGPSRKFRIRICHRNGTPIGFNTNCCLSVMTLDGDWSNILDDIMAGVHWKNDYLERDNKRLEANNRPAIAAFEKYIKAVYAN